LDLDLESAPSDISGRLNKQNFNAMFLYQVTVTVINQLLEKIREDLPGLEGTDETELIRKHFESTIGHVQLKKESPDEDSPSYEEIKI